MSTDGDQEPTSRPVRTDQQASGTRAGSDVTARMAGTHETEQRPAHDRTQVLPPSTDAPREENAHHEEHVETVRPTDRAHAILPAKTSAAAAFALVFGLAALFCALTAILSPAAVLFGVIGILLGIAGRKMALRPGITGRGVATGGLVTSILGLLLGLAVIAGAAVVVNDEQRLNQLEDRITDLRSNLPSAEQIREEIPG